MANKFELSKNQQRKKIKLLKKLKKDILKIEKQAKNYKLANLKIDFKKIASATAKATKFALPTILAGSIAYGLHANFIGKPFVLDDIKQPLMQEETISSKGDISIEQQYLNFSQENSIYYYSEWENEGESYSRNVYVYDLSDKNIKDFIPLKNELINTKALVDFFGEPKTIKTQKRKNITKEELLENAYLEAKIYSEIEEKYIYIKERVDLEFLSTLLFLLVEAIIISGTIFAGDRLNSLIEDIREMKKDFQHVDPYLLHKKLLIKKDTYERIVG